MLASPRVDLSNIELVYTKQHIMKVKRDLFCPCIDSYLIFIFVYNIVFSTGYVYLLYIYSLILLPVRFIANGILQIVFILKVDV